MNAPRDAEQRLEISRALCIQALKQPVWLLVAQRVSGFLTPASTHPETHEGIFYLLDTCIQSFLNKLDDVKASESESHPQKASDG